MGFEFEDEYGDVTVDINVDTSDVNHDQTLDGRKKCKKHNKTCQNDKQCCSGLSCRRPAGNPSSGAFQNLKIDLGKRCKKI